MNSEYWEHWPHWESNQYECNLDLAVGISFHRTPCSWGLKLGSNYGVPFCPFS